MLSINFLANAVPEKQTHPDTNPLFGMQEYTKDGIEVFEATDSVSVF